MKVRVHIFYKDSVFDPQGNTVAQNLQKIGFRQVANVRMGKVIDIEVNSRSNDQALFDAQKMCEQMLVNPVIESFKCEVVEGSK